MKRSRGQEEEEDSDLEHETQSTSRSSHSPSRISKFTGLDSAILDDDEEDPGISMRCSLPPHSEPLTFKSYDDYESHYHSFHSNRCLDCRKNFPSEHLLGVHIEEWHDPLVVVKRDRGEHTYSCFEKDCERKCLTHQKRRMHLVDKHAYPKNFFFGITKDGIDGRTSLLNNQGHHRRRSSATTQTKSSRRRSSVLAAQSKTGEDGEVKDSTMTNEPAREGKPAADNAMNDLAGAMSALKFVPHSVRFGRGRAGFSKQ